MGGRGRRDFHARRIRDARAFRPRQHRDGVSARRRAGRALPVARRCDRRVDTVRCRIRRAVRPARRHLHGARRPVPADVRDHAGCRDDRLPARRPRPPPGTRAGAARDRDGDRAHSQRPASIDFARPAHTARRDGGCFVDAGRVRGADAARSAAGPRPQRVRPVARAVRAGKQAAADDAPRRRGDQGRARLDVDRRRRRLGGSPAARTPGRPPADRRHPGRPASRCASTRRWSSRR